MKNYEDLVVWKKAFKPACEIYEITSNFPIEEKFGLSDQMRRSAVSIPSNIAGGSGRGFDKQYVQFLGVARGSCNELETQILISAKNKYITPEESLRLQSSCNEILKMLSAFIETLKNNNHSY